MPADSSAAFLVGAAFAAAAAAAALARRWRRQFGRRCDAVVTAAFSSAAAGSAAGSSAGAALGAFVASPLTPAMITQFRDRGFLVVRNVFTPEACARAQEACERLVDEEEAKLLDEGRLSPEDARRLASAPFTRRLLELYTAAGCVDDVPLLFRDRLHKPGFEEVFCNERVRGWVDACARGVRVGAAAAGEIHTLAARWRASTGGSFQNERANRYCVGTALVLEWNGRRLVRRPRDHQPARAQRVLCALE
jgi:hypothetical protein